MPLSKDEFLDKMQKGRERAAAEREAAGAPTISDSVVAREEPRQGGVAVADPPPPTNARPRRPTRTMSEIDHFRASRKTAAPVEEDLPLGNDDDERINSATVTTTRPELVRMYKPAPNGYIAVDVPEGNVETCWKAGYLDKCPDCGETTCGDGPGEQCPGRDPRGYRVCPVLSCQKPFVDEPLASLPEQNTADPNLIQDDSYATSTPATRTRAQLDAHMIAYHSQEAVSLAPHLQPALALNRMRGPLGG